MEWRGTPKWIENQNLLVLKIQGFDFLMQGFDFEVQGICSNINGNSRFWQSFDFVVEKKSKPKQNVNLLVLPVNQNSSNIGLRFFSFCYIHMFLKLVVLNNLN